MTTQKRKVGDIEIRYSDQGKGSPVVLLHGYLESLEIWQPFAEKLAKRYRVICPDTPGHGQSGIAGPVHSMPLMAASIHGLLDQIGIGDCVMIGHSMGGYVALAYADLYMDTLKGLVLFHSTPFADTEEKKRNRDREIELVRQGKKEVLFNTNIPKAFADSNLIRLKDSVEKAKAIGRGSPEDGIIALLEGMKQRADHSQLLAEGKVPLLWILGRKDNYILYDQARDKIDPGRNGRLAVLEESGHMGFVEEPESALSLLQEFIEDCI